MPDRNPPLFDIGADPVPTQVTARSTLAGLVFPRKSRSRRKWPWTNEMTGWKKGAPNETLEKRDQGLKPAVPWWFHFDPYPNEMTGDMVCPFIVSRTNADAMHEP